MTKTATRIPDYDPIEAMRDLMDMFHNARHEFADFGFGPEEPRDESGKWTAENIKGHLMARPGDKLADIAKGLGVKKQRGVAWENHPLGKAVAGMVASGHVEPKGEGYRMAARQPTVARLATAQPAASLPVDFPAKVLSSAKAAAAKGGHGVGSLGDKVTIAHAHRAYQQQHGQIPLDQFKQGLMKNRNNGISLMREDRPQRFDEPMQEDLRQSTIANPLNSNGMYDWHWLSTEPSQSSPVTAPALSAPVDTSRQLGLFARDDRGNPQEIGEQAGQANLFNMGKYALAEKPREEKVKPQFDPKHTGLLFCAEFASEYRDFMAMVNQARNDFASLFDKGPSTGGQGTLQWRTIGAEEGEDGKKHGGTHVLMNVESGEIAKGPKALAGKKVGELKSSGQQQSAPAPSKPSTGPKFSNPKKHPLYDQKTGRPMVHPDKPIEPAKGESETRPPERIAKPGAVDLTPQQSSPAAKPEPDIVRAAKFYGQMPPGYDKDRRIDPKSLPEHKPLTETTKSDEPKSDEELAKTEELVPNLERPWEMSGEDYLRAKQKQAKVFGEPELGAGIYNQQHEQEVAQAANRGEEIPEHVLNEYPHLAGEAMTEHHRRQQQEEMAHKIAEANSDMTDIPPQDTDTATAPPQQPIGIDGSQPTNQPPGLPSPAVQGDPANAPATRQSQEESSATVSSPQVQGIPTPATANETGQPAQQVAAAVPPAAAQQNPSVAGGEVDPVAQQRKQRGAEYRAGSSFKRNIDRALHPDEYGDKSSEPMSIKLHNLLDKNSQIVNRSLGRPEGTDTSPYDDDLFIYRSPSRPLDFIGGSKIEDGVNHCVLPGEGYRDDTLVTNKPLSPERIAGLELTTVPYSNSQKALAGEMTESLFDKKNPPQFVKQPTDRKDKFRGKVLFPSPDEKGKWQLSHYDDRGFYGHDVYPTKEEAAHQAIKDGFHLDTDNTLDSMSQSDTWKEGAKQQKLHAFAQSLMADRSKEDAYRAFVKNSNENGIDSAMEWMNRYKQGGLAAAEAKEAPDAAAPAPSQAPQVEPAPANQAAGKEDRQTPAVAGSTQGRTPTPTETAAPTTPVSEPENAATERTTPASPGIAKENQGDGRADSQPASGSEVAGEPAPGTQGQAEQTPEHAKLPESVKQRIQGHLDDIRDMKTALAHSREDRRVTQGTGIGTISGEDTPKEKALAAEIQQAEGKLDDFRQRAKSAGVDGDKVIDELSFKPSAERHDAIHKELSDIDQKMRSGKVQYPEIRELHNRRVDLEDELRHHKPAAWEREGQAVAKRAAQAASPAKPAAPTYSGTPAPTDEQMESAEMGNPTARSRSGEPILSDDQEKQWRDLRGQHHEHAYVHVPSAKRAMERAKAKADRIVKEKASQMDAANTLREHADRSGDSAHAQELRNQAQKHEQAANRMTDDVVKAQDEYAVAHQAHTDAITKRDAIAQQKEQLRPGSKWNDITRDPTSFAPMTPQQQTEHAKQLQKSHAVNQKAQAESAKREAQEKKKAEREQKQKEAEAAKASRPAKGEKPFSKADIQRKLIEAHKAQGGDTGEEDDKALADYHSPFTFLRTDKTKSGYPGEVERFLQQGKDRAKFNKLFSLTDDPAKAQGSDAMGNMGEDKYFDLAERRAGGENRQAIDWAHKSNDPEHRFLAALHDNTSVDTRALRSQLNSTRKQADKLEAKGDKISAEKKRALAQKIEDGLAKDAQSKRAPKDILKPDEVKEGDHFSIYGVPVDVVEGEDGGLDLKDHGDIPQTPVDALSAIPVDRGSKKHIAESELSDLDDPFADVMDEPSEEELRGERHHPDDVREAMRAEGVDPDHANETIKKLEAQHAATQGKKPEDASKESARTQEARPPTQAGGSDRPATGGAAQEEGVSPDTSHLVALRNGLSHEQSRLNNAKTDSERKHRQVWVNQYKKQIADEMKHLGMSGDEDSPDISDEDLLKSLGESSQEEGVLRPNPLKPSEESPHADELESGISAARKAGFTDQHIAQIHQQMQDKDGVLVVDPKKQSMRFYPSSSIFEPNKTPEQRRDEMGKVAGQKFLVKNASKKRASDAEKYQDRVHREGDWDSGNLAGWQRDILEQGVKSGKLTKRQGREDERTAMGIPTVYEPAGGKIANPPSMTPEQKAFYQNSQGWDNPAADTDHPLDRPLNRRPRANFSTDLDDVERKMDRMLAIAALV